MNYVPFVPVDPPLAGAVESVFVVEGYLPGHARERIVPNGRMTLVIELDGRPRHIYENESTRRLQECRGAWLSGVQSHYLTIGDTDVESRLAAVQFAPDGSGPFTHRAADGFCDHVTPAESVFGPSVLELRTELLGLTPQAVIDRLTGWLVERHDPAHEAPALVRRVVARLIENPGSVRLTELVESESSMSYKHFVDQFRKHVGPTPKSQQRILRFAEIFERIQGNPKVNWAELGYELGYSDQGHFVREFKAFSGYRPVQFQKQGHDRVNFFPEAAESSDG